MLSYYSTQADEMYGSYAFKQLDTQGKMVWYAPLAGIKEFKVPDAFLKAKGGVRAGGGEEMYLGTGLVNIDVVYLPREEAEFDVFLEKIAEFSKIQNPTQEDIQNYVTLVRNYNDNAYHLFAIMGIGNNGTLDDLKAILKENFMKNDLTEEDVDQLFEASEFIEAGSAENYNFFMIKRGYGSAFFKESQESYKEEYDALYDAAASYIENFTFMRPLALAEMVSEGTGLEFETKDLKDMKTVIRAIKRSEEDADEEIVLAKLFNAVDNRWLQTVFSNNKEGDFKIDKAKNNISTGWRMLVGDKTSKTGAILDNLIKEVMQEDNLIPA